MEMSAVPKRQFPRLPITLPAHLESRGHAWAGETDRLSLRGCHAVFPATHALPQAEGDASLTLTFPSGTFTVLAARVVTARVCGGFLAVALEFRHLDTALRAFLRLHLSAHARHEVGSAPARTAAV